MANVDRNFVLDLLAEHANIQQSRTSLFAESSPARSVVSGDRAYSLSLLIDAVEEGLLDRLADERAAREYEAYDAEAEDEIDAQVAEDDESVPDFAQSSGSLGAWADAAVLRAVRETIAESEADQ